MPLPFTTNYDLTGTDWLIIAHGATANPILLETKEGNVEYGWVPTATGAIGATVQIPDLDGHHLPQANSQGIGLSGTEALAVKATAGQARIAISGG